MTSLTEKIKIMQACLEGKTIQCQANQIGNYIDLPNPNFNWDANNYSIKEEPKKKVKLYQALLYSIPGYFYFNSDMYYPDLNTVLIRYKYNTSYKVIKLLPHTEIEVEIN